MQDMDDVEQGIYEVIDKHGPVGWYRIELRLRVDRGRFRKGWKLPDYLALMSARGLIRDVGEGKYVTGGSETATPPA